VPLAVTHPYGVSLLASIITMTPGTVSAEIDEDRREILVHVLDLADADALVADIKARYEAPLVEIFG
jgi:multicomponent K+:H+ antiporter subunit E